MTFETVVLMKKTTSLKPFSSMAELEERSDISYGLVKDGFTDDFFRTSDNRFFRDLYAGMDRSRLPLTSEDGVRKVGLYLFTSEKSHNLGQVSK